MRLRQALILQCFLLVISQAVAQEKEPATGLEVYGYIRTDIGYNFDQIDPNWFDVLRVSSLPQYKDQYAPDGRIFFSVRQTRMGFNSWSETPLGQAKARFEFDLFGVGPDVGQTTFHFRKAYVNLGRFTVGLTESTFSDPDILSTNLDFGSPSGLAYLRTIQVRYEYTSELGRWAIGLEQPGATADEGIYAERIELQNVKAEFKAPDLAAEYRRNISNGYVEVAGVIKWIRWENTVSSPIDLSGDEIGWGINISSTQKLGQQTIFKGQLVYGKGVQSHLTDASFNIGIKNNFDDPTTPLLGVALPVMGGLAFLEHNWNSNWSSTAGYSRVRIYNSDAQAPNAFRNGHYAILNVLYRPFPQLLTGAEVQWGKRGNFSDGFEASAVKVEVALKYTFSHFLFDQERK